MPTFTLYENRRAWAAGDNPIPVECETVAMAKVHARERKMGVIDWPEGLLVRAPNKTGGQIAKRLHRPSLSQT